MKSTFFRKLLIVFIAGILVFGCIGSLNVFVFSDSSMMHHSDEASCCFGGASGDAIHILNKIILPLDNGFILSFVFLLALTSVLGKTSSSERIDDYIKQIKTSFGSCLRRNCFNRFIFSGKLHPKII
jgi:hypothetical protein